MALDYLRTAQENTYGASVGVPFIDLTTNIAVGALTAAATGAASGSLDVAFTVPLGNPGMIPGNIAAPGVAAVNGDCVAAEVFAPAPLPGGITISDVRVTAGPVAGVNAGVITVRFLNLTNAAYPVGAGVDHTLRVWILR